MYWFIFIYVYLCVNSCITLCKPCVPYPYGYYRDQKVSDPLEMITSQAAVSWFGLLTYLSSPTMITYFFGL